jgi:hypothetical protein
MSRTELESIPLVEEKFVESNAKLAGYRQTLEQKYGEQLRLHSYSVVSLGFERLVWREVKKTSL